MTDDRRTILLLADVTDAAPVLADDTVRDVVESFSAALRENALEPGLIDGRLLPATGTAEPFAQLVNRHLLPLPRPQRWAALALLAELLHETRAEERRRLASDPQAYELAVRLTCDEIDRHAVPRRSV